MLVIIYNANLCLSFSLGIWNSVNDIINTVNDTSCRLLDVINVLGAQYVVER